MSFWDTSEGKSATKTATGKFESSANIELIPHNTTALASVTKTSIEQFDGNEFINIQWTLLKPATYKNRVVFQKVRVWDSNLKKADKAKEMLANIDKNAGGKLAQSDKDPTNETLTQALQSKTMLINILVYEILDKKGNYIGAVSPRTNDEPAPVVAKPTPVVDEDIDEDNLPF